MTDILMTDVLIGEMQNCFKIKQIIYWNSYFSMA